MVNHRSPKPGLPVRVWAPVIDLRQMKLIRNIFNLPSIIRSQVGKIYQELKLVDWLNWRKVVIFTVAVISVSVVTALIILAADTVYVSIRNYLLNV